MSHPIVRHDHGKFDLIAERNLYKDGLFSKQHKIMTNILHFEQIAVNRSTS